MPRLNRLLIGGLLSLTVVFVLRAIYLLGLAGPGFDLRVYQECGSASDRDYPGCVDRLYNDGAWDVGWPAWLIAAAITLLLALALVYRLRAKQEGRDQEAPALE